MKARVKATGETIEVMQVYEKGESFYVRLDMLSTTEVRYHISELEFEGFETEGKFAEACLNGIKQGVDYNPNYWTRLEHTYVGMFMKSFLDNFDGTATMEQLSDDAIALAHALVEKMKEEK